MAFKKAKSRKCPVCTLTTPEKAEEVDQALGPLLTHAKKTGEIPKATDQRFKDVSSLIGIAPNSLRFHLRNCLVDMEIQDQRFQELKDLTELLSTAKAEYQANPSMNTATAVNQLLTQWRGLAEDIEGQQDPSQTVDFLVEVVLGPMNRVILAETAKELREVREAVKGLVPKNNQPYVISQVNAALSRISAALRDATDDGLKNICGYYKVELEAQQRKRAMETADSRGMDSGSEDTSEGEEAVH